MAKLIFKNDFINIGFRINYNYMLLIYILFVSSLFSINPPKNGGTIPEKYLDIFKKQNIIYNNLENLKNNNMRRSNIIDIQSPPSNYKLPVLLVEFSDGPYGQISKEEFQEHLFGDSNPTGSLSDYYNEISYGKFNLTGDVYGWYRSDSSEEEAFENISPFITSILDDANLDVNFSQYDNDSDGVVDALMIVFPGTGADEEGENSGNIWPHMSVLFNEDGTAYYLGEYDNVTFSKYAVCPEHRKVGNQNQYEIRPIGVFAHEFGHTLGLPDLYERPDDNGESVSEGVGEWCLMGSGSWNGVDGDTPSHMSAWCKYKLGWSDPIVLDQDSIVIDDILDELNFLSLDNVEENDGQIYKIYADSYRWNEYFLLENRQLTGFDSEQNGSGLLIYHIDENQFFGMGRLFGAGINNDNASHKLVDVEEADGEDDLDTSQNRGDNGDPFPGSSENITFSYPGNPNSNNYNGQSSSIEISNIQPTFDGAIKMNILIPTRDGSVLAYDNGISAAYGSGSELSDYSYTVKFTAPRDVYLTRIDVGLYADISNIDLKIYRSMGSQGFYDKLFEQSYGNLPSSWNILDIDPLEFESGQVFYAVVTNKETSYGIITDYTFNDNNSHSYIYSSSSSQWGSSSIGNLCIRARFDESGGLNIIDNNSIPSGIHINNAYPNPFNPVIHLSYGINVHEDISINVYDLKGRLVDNIVNNPHVPGNYDISWNAKNLSSGIYFIHYTAGLETFKQKITLLK